MISFDKSAQGALEYLLIIGGAIVLAAIVVAIVFSMTDKTSNVTNNKFNDFNNLIDGATKSTDSVNDVQQTKSLNEQKVIMERSALVTFGYIQNKNPSSTIIVDLNKNKNTYSLLDAYGDEEFYIKYDAICNTDFCKPITSNHIDDYAKWFCLGNINANVKDNELSDCISKYNDPKSCILESKVTDYTGCVSKFE